MSWNTSDAGQDDCILMTSGAWASTAGAARLVAAAAPAPMVPVRRNERLETVLALSVIQASLAVYFVSAHMRPVFRIMVGNGDGTSKVCSRVARKRLFVRDGPAGDAGGP